MSKPKRLQKKIRNWWYGYIDFSTIEVDGYQYKKCTYGKKLLASALITEENIDIITALIPLFSQVEKSASPVMKLFYRLRSVGNNFEDSYLFNLYCNGFTSGYKDIDTIIEKNCLSVAMLEDKVNNCIKQLEDLNKRPTDKTKDIATFRDYLLDLGEHEGMIVRKNLYKLLHQPETSTISIPCNKETEKATVKTAGRKADTSTLPELLLKNRDKLIGKIEARLRVHATETDIARLYIALVECHFIYHKCFIKTFRNALQSQYKDMNIVNERGIQKAYKNLTTPCGSNNKLMKDTGEDFAAIEELKAFLSE